MDDPVIEFKKLSTKFKFSPILGKAANLPTSDDTNNSKSPKPPLTKRSSSFSDSPMTITTTKIVRSSTTNVLIPPKVPIASKALNIPKLTTTPSSSNEQEVCLKIYLRFNQ